VADMVIPFGRYGLFVWPMGLWPIWCVADMVQTLHFSFLSRVSTLTRDIDIAILSVRSSVRLSVRDVLVSDENGLTYYISS